MPFEGLVGRYWAHKGNFLKWILISPGWILETTVACLISSTLPLYISGVYIEKVFSGSHLLLSGPGRAAKDLPF